MDLNLLIFNMYKDTDVIGKKFKLDMTRKYKLKDTEISDIRAKINQYQIKKYGSVLGTDKGYKTKEECEHLSVVSNKRKSSKRNYERRVK